MLLNKIQTNVSNIVFRGNSRLSSISFGKNNDCFERSNIDKFEFDDSLSQEAKKQLLSKIKYISENQSKILPMGYGATGVVYHIDNIDGVGRNGVVVKFSYTEDKNPLTGEKQKVNYSYNDEIKILKKVKKLGDKSQQYLGNIKLSDGRNVLITTFVEGKQPDIKGNPIGPDNLKSILSSLYELDELGILHRDLKKENLVLDYNDSNLKIIDYGESVEFNILDFQGNDSHNFAPFEIPTNLQSFEDTFIAPYIDELQSNYPDDAKDLFSFYLKEKANIIYKPKAESIALWLNDNKDKLSALEIEKINTMIDYQATMGEVLSKECQNDDIVSIELMKNQVLYMSELAYKNEILIGNPLANVALKTNALICAKKLESMILKQIKRPNKPEVQKYLYYQLEGAKYRQQKIAGWLNGLVGWVCTCLTSDIDTADASKRKLIEECLCDNLENFIIPNIAQNKSSKGRINEVI